MIHNTDCNEISQTMLANQFKDSAILVTGATGMIGQNSVRIIMELNELYNANITLFAHVRNRNKCNIVLENYASIPNFKIVECDITSPFFKEELSGRYIDYIIHTVGVTGGSLQHLQRPMDTIDVSLRGTRNVLDLSKNTQCKGIVFTSSLEVYGNTGVDKPYIFETDGGYIDPVNVRSSYSESKRMCECMFASYAKQYGIPATVARLTASFGYGVSYADNRVFAQFAKNIIEHKAIILRTTGETVRDYCDAEDVAVALLTLLLRGVQGEASNVANMDTEISINELALQFIESDPESETILQFDLGEDAAKFGYNKTMRNVLDSHKLMSLGWQPKYGIEDMIRHLIASMIRSKNTLC